MNAFNNLQGFQTFQLFQWFQLFESFLPVPKVSVVPANLEFKAGSKRSSRSNRSKVSKIQWNRSSSQVRALAEVPAVQTVPDRI